MAINRTGMIEDLGPLAVGRGVAVEVNADVEVGVILVRQIQTRLQFVPVAEAGLILTVGQFIVPLPGENGGRPGLSEQGSQAPGYLQIDVLFQDPGAAHRSGIDPPVAGVDHDHLAGHRPGHGLHRQSFFGSHCIRV